MVGSSTSCLLYTSDVYKRQGSPYGGEKGIRTLEALSTLTRFPVVRLRPAQPSLRAVFALTKTLYHLLFALSSKKCIFLTTTTKIVCCCLLVVLDQENAWVLRSA